MAKAKSKSKKITLEEVLVPVEEQPYEVPENWCWIKLGAISSIISKGTTPKGGKSAYVDEGIDFLRVENINDDGTICHDNMMHVTEETHTGFLKRSILEENDVLVSIAGTLGKTAIVKKDDLPLNTNQAVAFVRLADNGEISREYIRYAIDTPVIQNYLLSKTKVTAIPNLTLEIISECLIPLPPLAEQKRIAEQIEYLFAKLDEAKEKAQDVVDDYDVRYASILRSLFNGELSKEWRKENSICKDSWASCLFDTCIEKMQNGLAKRSGTEGKLFGVLRLANLGEDDFDTEDLREIRLTEKEQEKYKLNVGDIIMIRVNGSRDNVGRQLLVDEEQNWAFCDHIMRMKLTEDILPQYMVLFSKTDEYRYYIEEHMVSSAGQNTISRKGMSELAIPVPSIEEQEYMVKVIDRLISKEKLVKEKAESVIEQIELIKKSILAKAFRGELGTNIPEESSIELLKKMIEEG